MAVMRFVRALAGTNLRAAVALRGAFWTQALFMVANNLIFFTVWLLFFNRFESVRGWQLGDMAALYGVAATAFGMAVVLGEGVRDVARMIVEGDLDAYLTQPKPVVLQVVACRSNPAGWGDIVSGLILLGLSGYVTWASVPWLLLAPTLGALAIISVALIVGSMAFWFGPLDTLARQIVEFTVLCAVYPSSIFSGVLRIVLFTLIPAGFVSHLPVTLVRDFSWPHLGLAVGGTSGLLALASFTFHRGLRRYSSGNRFGVRA